MNANSSPLDFETLAEVMPQIIWTANPDGWLDYYNDQWFEYTGMTLEQTQGWGWEPVLHPDDLELCLDRWQTTVETGCDYEVEYRFLRASDKTYRWHLGRARPLRGEGGQIIKWVGTCTDIQEQKQVAADADARERQFRTLVGSVPGAVYRYAYDAKVMHFVSSRIQDLTGYPPDDFLRPAPRTFLSLLHPDDLQQVECTLNRAVTAESSFELEYRIIHRNGEVRWMYERGSAVRPVSEGELWLDGVILDVTARQEAEEARAALLEQVQAERTLMRDVLEQLPNAVWLAEAPSGKLLLGNRSIDRLWGHPFLPAAAIDEYQKYSGFHLDGRPVQSHEWPLARAVREGAATLDEEIDVLRSDGTLRRAVFSAAPIYDAAGLQVAAVATGTDVSERTHAAQAIRELNAELERRVELRTKALVESEAAVKAFASQLERSNRELQDFALVASHDLQEPLRKVQAFADRLKTRYAPELGEEGRDYLDRMQAAASRMQRLINDLLDLSRITTRARPFVPVDLAQVIGDVTTDLELRIETLGGSVEADVRSIISGDPTQIRQLFQNLIVNALKFHREEAPVVRLRSFLQSDCCVIEVQDNGLGFDEKYLDRIFTPFQRLHGRNTFEGTGMGLTICRKIAERHGGTITARSVLEEGSTFRVMLPLFQELPQGGGE